MKRLYLIVAAVLFVSMVGAAQAEQKCYLFSVTTQSFLG
ncbi:unnamed protein product, partial [marine sediment metagenome]